MAWAMTVNAILVSANAVLLLGLLAMYASLLRQAPTRFTWGLAVFAGLLFIQNAVQLYFFATMMNYFAGGVENLVLVQNTLATAGIAFLAYVTWSPAPGPRKQAAQAPTQ